MHNKCPIDTRADARDNFLILFDYVSKTLFGVALKKKHCLIERTELFVDLTNFIFGGNKRFPFLHIHSFAFASSPLLKNSRENFEDRRHEEITLLVSYCTIGDR